MRRFMALALIPLAAWGAITNELGHVVLINDAGQTRPANSIATPAQVTDITESSGEVKNTAEALLETATAADTTANGARASAYLYSSNYVVTSTVYVQSIGGVPYDSSNQTINVYAPVLTATNVSIVATVKQTPLTTPVLDWRVSLNGGAWSNIAATVTATDIPAGVTNAAAAYLFTLPRTQASAFYRVVDNSTGASGSGLYWLVYGGIFVDGKRGVYGAITNAVGASTNVYLVKGGIIVEPEPL